MKEYHAILNRTSEAIEVEFPDLPGCVTFGQTREEAIENAIDVLAAWLANAETRFIKKPSEYQELRNRFGDRESVAVSVDEDIMRSYQSLKAVQRSLPGQPSQRGR